MANLLKKLIGEESGTALVETAFVLPLLVLLGFGGFYFANAFFDHQEITTGIRDAARYLARVPDPNNGTFQQNARNLAVFGNIAGSGTPRVPGWTATATIIPITITAVDNKPVGGVTPLRGPDPIYIVTVRTAFPYDSTGFYTTYGLAKPTFRVAHSERSLLD